MSAKKRFLSGVLCLLLCLTALPAPAALAADGGDYQVMPCMEYISRADHAFSIDGGVASMYGYVEGMPGLATKCEVSIELQEKGLLLWNEVDTWTDSRTGTYAELDLARSVTEGEKYRIVVTVTVWSGSDSETQTLKSEAIEA